MLKRGDSLYVGGAFNQVNSQPRSGIAEVSTTNSAVSLWNPNVDLYVYTIELSQNPLQLLVGGFFNTVGGQDRDCSSEEAEADFQRGASRYTPVAPLASLELLRDQLGSLTGRSVILYGDDDFFVRCLRTLLQNDGAVVRLFPRQSNEPVGAADALVVSESLPPVAMLQSIERLELLLDAGYYMKPRPANWIPPEIAARIDIHLGQYQNVGPLTVAHLADATVLAAHGRIRSGI
jgi:hypothetical protein